MNKVKDKGIKAFFKILWGTNEPELSEENDEIQEEIQKSIDRINRMAQKYGTEVSRKTPKMKKAVVKNEKENKQEQKTRNAGNRRYDEERE